MLICQKLPFYFLDSVVARFKVLYVHLREMCVIDLEISVVVWSDAHKSHMFWHTQLSGPGGVPTFWVFMCPGDNVPTLVVWTPTKYLLLDAIYSIC